MKIIAFSRNGKMAKIGEDSENSKWFFFSEKVEGFISKLKPGAEVEIQTQETDGKQIITFVKPLAGGGASFSEEPPTESFPPEAFKGFRSHAKGEIPPNPWYGRQSPEVQNSIKRQAIGHMVSRTIIGLQGMVDLNNVNSVIDTLYKKYVEVVG